MSLLLLGSNFTCKEATVPVSKQVLSSHILSSTIIDQASSFKQFQSQVATKTLACIHLFSCFIFHGCWLIQTFTENPHGLRDELLSSLVCYNSNSGRGQCRLPLTCEYGVLS